MNTPLVDRHGALAFPDKAVASVADLFALCVRASSADSLDARRLLEMLTHFYVRRC